MRTCVMLVWAIGVCQNAFIARPATTASHAKHNVLVIPERGFENGDTSMARQ